jgi:hypothetical protein
VNNVSSANIHNTYVDRTVINNNTSKVSYNGGKGGMPAQSAAQERQVQPTSVQQPEAIFHSQAPIQQKAVLQQEPAQALQPEHQQLQPQSQQPGRQQGQVQPKQEAKPSQQAAPQVQGKGPAAQPDKKSDNAPNNASGH